MPFALARLCGAFAEKSAQPAGAPVGICFLAARSMSYSEGLGAATYVLVLETGVRAL